MEKITLGSAKTLTLEQIQDVAENKWESQEVIDYSQYKNIRKAMREEQDNIEAIAFAIKNRAEELGIKVSSDEDAFYNEETEGYDLGGPGYALYEFMQDVASEVGQRYGGGEYGEGSEDYFWVPSTC